MALNAVGSLGALASLVPTVSAFWPKTFEELGVPSGIVIYSSTVPMRMVSGEMYISLLLIGIWTYYYFIYQVQYMNTSDYYYIKLMATETLKNTASQIY